MLTRTRSAAKGRSAAEDGEGPVILFRAVKRPTGATENSRPVAIAWPYRLPQRSPSMKARDAAFSDNAGKLRDPIRHVANAPASASFGFAVP